MTGRAAKAGRSNSDRDRCAATGKVCLTRQEAHVAARSLNGRQQRDRAPVHAYACREGCGSWHTGHVPKDRRRHQPSPRGGRKGGRGRRGR